MKRRPKSPGGSEHDQLHEHIEDTRKKITLLKPKDSASLLEQLAEIEKKLESLKDTPLSYVQLHARMAEIEKIDEKAEKRKQNFWTRILPEQNEVAIELIKVVIGPVLLALIGLLGAAGRATPSAAASPTAISFSVENPSASATPMPGNAENVAVSFENSNSIDVQLIIRNEADPRQTPQSPIIEAGGSLSLRDLVPGEYTIEVKPRYPEMTLQANCSVQWQQDDSYRGNLVLTSGKTVIQIKHFELRPEQICLSATPSASTPTPSP